MALKYGRGTVVGRRTAGPCRAVSAPASRVLAVKPVAALNQLEALKSMSTVVADTGEAALVKLFRPVDCTTNPRWGSKGVTQGT